MNADQLTQYEEQKTALLSEFRPVQMMEELQSEFLFGYGYDSTGGLCSLRGVFSDGMIADIEINPITLKGVFLVKLEMERLRDEFCAVVEDCDAGAVNEFLRDCIEALP